MEGTEQVGRAGEDRHWAEVGEDRHWAATTRSKELDMQRGLPVELGTKKREMEDRK